MSRLCGSETTCGDCTGTDGELQNKTLCKHSSSSIMTLSEMSQH